MSAESENCARTLFSVSYFLLQQNPKQEDSNEVFSFIDFVRLIASKRRFHKPRTTASDVVRCLPPAPIQVFHCPATGNPAMLHCGPRVRLCGPSSSLSRSPPRAHLFAVRMLLFMSKTETNRASQHFFFLLFCCRVCFCLCGPFNCIPFHKFS